MPGRSIPLVTNEIYHIFNRGVDHRPTFLNKKEFKRAIKVMNFYRFAKLPVRLSFFLIWAKERREELLNEYEKKAERLIDIISFCLMPNHFHFLLRQKTSGGIAKFMSNFQNSYTRYFNTRHKRIGPLFLDQFKAVRIETDEQFLHVSRYIHLNPYSSFVVKTLRELKEYLWSSLPESLGLQQGICQTDEVTFHFQNKSTYQKFIFNQADYQRNLEKIKHLTFE